MQANCNFHSLLLLNCNLLLLMSLKQSLPSSNWACKLVSCWCSSVLITKWCHYSSVNLYCIFIFYTYFVPFIYDKYVVYPSYCMNFGSCTGVLECPCCNAGDCYTTGKFAFGTYLEFSWYWRQQNKFVLVTSKMYEYRPFKKFQQRALYLSQCWHCTGPTSCLESRCLVHRTPGWANTFLAIVFNLVAFDSQWQKVTLATLHWSQHLLLDSSNRSWNGGKYGEWAPHTPPGGEVEKEEKHCCQAYIVVVVACSPLEGDGASERAIKWAMNIAGAFWKCNFVLVEFHVSPFPQLCCSAIWSYLRSWISFLCGWKQNTRSMSHINHASHEIGSVPRRFRHFAQELDNFSTPNSLMVRGWVMSLYAGVGCGTTVRNPVPWRSRRQSPPVSPQHGDQDE